MGADTAGPRLVAMAAAVGLVVGILARLWMRWISTDPEFTWAGTIGIVLGFVLFAIAQSTAAVLRRRPAGRAVVVVARIAAGLLSLGLFVAAGAQMLPTVVLGGLALWRTGWPLAARVVLAALACVVPFLVVGDIVDDFGWSIATVGRIVAFGAIYAVVILGVGPTMAAFSRGTATR